MPENQHLATFAAGCFWGVEHTFAQLPGVQATRVGYIGGNTEFPSYEQVCSGTTNHAEAVEITYDPDNISYEYLVSVFLKLHDPTQLNRQGPDVGTQYRSAIFTHTDDQMAIAQEILDDAADDYEQPIATQLRPAATFWPAEEYHQQYFAKKGIAPTCGL